MFRIAVGLALALALALAFDCCYEYLNNQKFYLHVKYTA
jgi:hypothetical protein